MDISNFTSIAPFLTNPLTLIGFVIFIFISLLAGISKSKFFAKITGKDTAKIIKTIIILGFIIAILVIIGGFGVQTYKMYLSNKKPTENVDFLESGITNYKTEKYYEAIRDLKIAVKKENNVGKSCYYIGMSYHFLDKDNEACEYLQKAKKNNYDYDPVDFCD